MPKKSAAPPADDDADAEGPSAEEQFRLDALAAQAAADAAVDAILDKGGRVLYEKYLKQRVVPYISHRALRDAVSMVNWLNLVRDSGEPEGPARADNWYVDAEPRAVPVDTWASGTIGMRTRASQSRFVPLSSRGSAAGGKDGEPSVAGTARTRRSGRPGSRGTARSRGTRATRRGKDKAKDPEQLLAERIVVLTDEQLGIRDASDAAGATGAGKPKVTREERARLRAIREMERAEKELLRRAEAEKQRKVDEQNAHEAMMKELKGKEWTLDRDGKVIVIKPPNPAKLPSYTDTPDVFVHGDDAGAGAGAGGRSPTRSGSAGSSGGAQSSPKRGGGSPGKSKRKRRQQNEDFEQFYRESVSQQPPLLQSMELCTGVTLTEGEGKKAGPRAEANPKRMSRHDFLMHQTLVEEPAAGEAQGLNPESASAPGSPTNAASTDPMLQAEIEAKLASAMADVDVTAGARALSSAGGMSSMAEDDENLRLISAADWGANPAQSRDAAKPPVPHKPTERERIQTLGRPGEARDRKFVNKVAGSSPTRLPPPLSVGSVVGHGLADLGDSRLMETTGDMEGGDSMMEGTGTGQLASSMRVGSPPSSPYRRDWGVVGPADSVQVSDAASKYFGK